jgi:glucose dehydrogenase
MAEPSKDRRPKAVIIGSGIAGSLVAFQLVGRGYDVEVFEKGPAYPYPHAPAFAERTLYHWENPAYVLPADIKNLATGGNYAGDINQERIMLTGGSATHWGAVAERMHPEDFRLRSIHGYSDDWPLSYGELEPDYCTAERLLGVSGSQAGNPHAAPRSEPFPLPAFEFTPDIRNLARRLQTGGLALHPTAQARTRLAFDGRPPCENYGTCNTCPIGARYSPTHHLLKAIQTGYCRLHNNVSVRRILVARAGKIEGILFRPHGNGDTPDQECPADLVIVAAGAIESARLLLLSRSEQHPDGIGNSSGHVGSHLTLQNIWLGLARYKEQMLAGRVGADMGISRQFLNPENRKLHRGLLVQIRSEPPNHGPASAHASRKASVLSPAQRLLQERSLDPYCQVVHLHGECTTSPDKKVTLSTEKRDRFGDRFAHVEYRMAAGDHENHRFARGIMEKIAHTTAAVDWDMWPAGQAVSGNHHVGTCRMSLHPRDGVVDSHCRVHGVPGLYVIGASAFAAPTAVHPTLTIAALALRAARSMGG